MKNADVNFVVVGGFAGICHGCTMVTQDVDICCEFSEANLLRLQKAIGNLNPVHRMTPNKVKLDLVGGNIMNFKNLYLDTDIGQLDCLSYIDGAGDYNSVVKASMSITIGGIELNVLSIDALIEAKKKLNRPRDKEAVIQLEALKKLKRNSEDIQE